MGWYPTTYIYMGSPEDVAEAYRRHLPAYEEEVQEELDAAEAEAEPVRLPANMDNSAARISYDACFHFAAQGTCPFGVNCHYAHIVRQPSDDAFGVARERQESALNKLVQVATDFGTKYDVETLLWEFATKKFPGEGGHAAPGGCPTFQCDDACSGTSLIHVTEPAKHVASLISNGKTPALDTRERLRWLFQEARRTPDTTSGYMLPLEYGYQHPNTRCLEHMLACDNPNLDLKAEVSRVREQFLAKIDDLENPRCTCGAAPRQEPGEDYCPLRDLDSIHDEYCPASINNKGAEFPDPYDNFSYNHRNVRRRGSDYDRRELRDEKVRALFNGCERLEEAMELISGMNYTPSRWTLDRLKKFSEGAAEASVLSACTRPWQVVLAVKEANRPSSSKPSALEWLQFAVAEAATTGQQVLVRHEVV